jgi:hypothetical protein
MLSASKMECARIFIQHFLLVHVHFGFLHALYTLTYSLSFQLMI